MPIAVDTDYTTDTDPKLKNPERGMYFGESPGSNEFHTIVAEWLWLHEVCSEDLAWNGYEQPGTSPVLNAYAQRLEEHRKTTVIAGEEVDLGVKVLFRPRYDKRRPNEPSDCIINGARVFHADSKTRQFNHIDAVAAMLGDYRDVIAFIQAGYLGNWGEWNTGGEWPDSVDYEHINAPLLYSYEDRSDILDRVLSAYAAAGILHDVELRTPVLAEEVIRRDPSARVGLHNDCFMSTEDDMGTYALTFPDSPVRFVDLAEAKSSARSLTANASFGGETCPAGGTERWRRCDNMIFEPAALHVNYLNGDWASDAVKTWQDGGCYNEIRSRLGHRFEVTRVEYTPTVASGQDFSVAIDIMNSGWARLHKPRKAKLVLRSASTAQDYDLSAGETNSWGPGDTTRISVTGAPPPAGAYGVRLAIPDPDAPKRIAYAVRLASTRGDANVFDHDTGENDLGVSITVQ